MSINFGQFPTPTLPIQATDMIVGYQRVGMAGVPTLAQYSFQQVANYIGTIVFDPAAFGVFFLAWFNSLPTTLPATPGVMWNNGGTLAQS